MTVVDHGFPFVKYLDTRRVDAHCEISTNPANRDMPGHSGALARSGPRNGISVSCRSQSVVRGDGYALRWP
jgi:hypothetical protein